MVWTIVDRSFMVERSTTWPRTMDMTFEVGASCLKSVSPSWNTSREEAAARISSSASGIPSNNGRAARSAGVRGSEVIALSPVGRRSVRDRWALKAGMKRAV